MINAEFWFDRLISLLKPNPRTKELEGISLDNIKEIQDDAYKSGIFDSAYKIVPQNIMPILKEHLKVSVVVSFRSHRGSLTVETQEFTNLRKADSFIKACQSDCGRYLGSSVKVTPYVAPMKRNKQ